MLARLSLQQVRFTDLAGENARTTVTGALIGGLKAVPESRWFAAGTSRMEDIYKLNAESFLEADPLCRFPEETSTIANHTLAASPQSPEIPSAPQLEENP